MPTKDWASTILKGLPKKAKGKPLHVLVDGDLVAYRSASATQGVSYDIHNAKGARVGNEKYHKAALAWAEGYEESFKDDGPCTIHKKSSPEPLDKAVKNIRSIMGSAKSDLEDKLRRPVEFDVFLTSDSLFRDTVCPTYKKSREGIERPKNLKGCKEFLEKTWDAETVPGYEADDLMAMGRIGYGIDDSIIMSLDKDLRQIPGKHYDFVKQVVYDVNEHEARQNFWAQVLTGDKTDDIPGIYGVGPVTARKILNELEPTSTDWEYYRTIVQAYTDYVPRHKDESRKDYFTRIIQSIGTSARLLYLSRHMGDTWDVPETTGPLDMRGPVSGDTQELEEV